MEVLIPKPNSWYAEAGPSSLVRGGQTRIFGPYHDDGDPWERVKFSKRELSLFSQGHRLFNENSVYHQKIDGKIFVIPGLKKAVPAGRNELGKDLHDMTFKDSFGKSISFSRICLDIISTGEYLSGQSQYVSKQYNYTAQFTMRPSHWEYAGVRLTTNSDGRYGNTWQRLGSSSKVTKFDKSTVTFQEITTTPRALSGKDNRIPGALDLASGMILAKSSIPQGNFGSVTYTRTKLFLEEPGFSMSEIRTWITKLLHPQLLDDLPSLNLDNWGDLVHHATANLDANSANMIAFVRDLKDIKSLIPKLKELRKLSTHASNYLAVEYGVLPTISDLKAIWKALSPTKYYDRSGFRRVSAYDSSGDQIELLGELAPIQHTRRLHVAVNDRDTGLDSLVERARSMGVFPSLTNIWDLIPYSFVIDWFVDVGSVLERIDTKHRLLNLDIPYVIHSDKIVASVTKTNYDIGIGMSVELTKYNRHVTRSVPQPRIFGEINKPPSVQDHWIEGSALILQRTK